MKSASPEALQMVVYTELKKLRNVDFLADQEMEWFENEKFLVEKAGVCKKNYRKLNP